MLPSWWRWQWWWWGQFFTKVRGDSEVDKPPVQHSRYSVFGLKVT